MADTNFVTTSTVSHDRDTKDTSFQQVVWRKGKPPLDSEFNLTGQISAENLRVLVKSQSYSGFLLDPLDTKNDFVFDPPVSRTFYLKPMRACVDGRILEVRGAKSITQGSPPVAVVIDNPADRSNPVVVDPVDSSSVSRTDLVYLEVWEEVLKPSTESGTLVDPGINKYGNLSNPVITGEGLKLVDTDIGIETSHRVQLKYKIRVAKSVASLNSVRARAYSENSFDNSAYFTQSPVDPGLWVYKVAADSKLATTTVWALPICTVSRRNSGAYAEYTVNNTASNLYGVGSRPDNRTLDGVYPEDVLDLRNGVFVGSDPNSVLEHNLKDLFLGKLGTKTNPTGFQDQIRVDTFSEGTTNSPYSSLHYFPIGRTNFADGIHKQKLETFVKFDTDHSVTTVNPSAGTINWSSVGGLTFGNSVSKGFNSPPPAGGPFKFNKGSFITLNFSGAKPSLQGSAGAQNCVSYSGKTAVSTYLGDLSKSNFPVAGTILKDVANSNITSIASGSLTLPSTNLQGITQAVIDAEAPVLIIYAATNSTVLGAYKITTITGGTTLALTDFAGYSNPPPSDKLSFQIRSTKKFKITDNDIVVYNTDVTDANINLLELEFLYSNSRAFGTQPSKHHYLKAFGPAFSSVMDFVTATDHQKFTARPFASHYSVASKKEAYQSSLFVDEASRSMLFTPYQYGQFDLHYSSTNSVDITSPGLKTADATPAYTPFSDLFATENNGKYRVVPLPPYCRMTEGWVDIPYAPTNVAGNSNGSDHFFGYNHIFTDHALDGSNGINKTYWVLGGAAGSMDPMYFKAEPNIQSPDTELGKVMANAFGTKSAFRAIHVQTPIEGIKLPKNIAPGRIFAIYEGATISSGTNYTARNTPNAGLTLDPPGSNITATNKLKPGVNQKTFYREGDHYYIPKELINGYSASKTYTFECLVFGFPDGSFDKALVRKTQWATTQTPYATANFPSLTACRMNFFGPAPKTDQNSLVLNVYSTIPYQGSGADNSGILGTPAPVTKLGDVTRFYQILASRAFSTTLGTGKPSGKGVFGVGVESGPDTLLDTPTNNSYTPAHLTGLTSRLPVGLSLRDSLFAGEDPLNSGSSQISFNSSSVSHMGQETDFLIDGRPAPRSLGNPGDIIGVNTTENTSGTFQVRRGLGSAFVVGRDGKMGALDWLSGEIPAANTLDSKVLSGMAYLVRDQQNFIKMVVCTFGHGKVSSQRESLYGVMAPSGIGSGLASVDVFDVQGRPIHHPENPFPVPVEFTYSPWSSSKNYLVGDKVIWNGSVYRAVDNDAISTNTYTNLNQNPTAQASAYWVKELDLITLFPQPPPV